MLSVKHSEVALQHAGRQQGGPDAAQHPPRPPGGGSPVKLVNFVDRQESNLLVMLKCKVQSGTAVTSHCADVEQDM